MLTWSSSLIHFLRIKVKTFEGTTKINSFRTFNRNFDSNFQSTAELSPQFILYDVLCIVSSLMWPYLFCDYATFATHGIASIKNIIYESNWYDYPPQLRKAIILIIAHSQQPFNFVGFNLIRCNLEIFGKVNNLNLR